MGTRDYLHTIIIKIKCYIYQTKYKRIRNEICKKKKIKVVFFVLYNSMWKSDGLFRLLMADKRFDPFIISTPYPEHPRKLSQNNQAKVKEYFISKGFPFIEGYDFVKDKVFDIHSFCPDIVFYQQPYKCGRKEFRIEKLWKNCLFGYIPYTSNLEIGKAFHNTLLHNIAWKVFLPTVYEKRNVCRQYLGNGNNLIVTGHVLADKFILSNNTKFNVWKHSDAKLKRIIWAPHHSVLDSDHLNFANFLEIADSMLNLCHEYIGKVQFVFKPHPVLKSKLYSIKEWGEERTEKYYKEWSNGLNTFVQEGEYVDLFLTSDAMVHDSASFTEEYLFTKKPVLYVAKEGHEEFLTEYGKLCYHQHYIGHTIEDIRRFIDEIVIGGKDPKRTSREEFFNQYLLPPNGKSTAVNMYEEFLKLVRND